MTCFVLTPRGSSGGPCGPPECPQGKEGDAKDIFVITEAYVTTCIRTFFELTKFWFDPKGPLWGALRAP